VVGRLFNASTVSVFNQLASVSHGITRTWKWQVEGWVDGQL
jgi:hypothetical protein